MSKVESTAAPSTADASATKFEVKHAFGCQVPKMDAVQSFAATSGDKEYSDRLVYKVGKQACIFNPETGKQEFFDRPKQFTDVLHFCISPNNRFISMCETSRNDKTNEVSSSVSVYSLATLNRLKTLTHAVSRPYVCSTFCGDPKLLAALSDEPDRHIVVWQWEKEKLYKTVSISNNISVIRGAPSPNLMLTTTGNGIIRNWCIAADAMLKSNNFLPPAKESSENFLDHVWLPSNAGLHKMVALADAESGHENAASRTRKQNIYIFEGREVPHNSNVGTPSAPTMPIALELKQTIVLKLELGSRMEKVIPSAKLFMLVGSFGLVATYERTDDKHDPYIETRRISLGDKHLVGGTIYPSEEKMVLVTKNSRLFNMALDVTIDQIKMSSNNNAGDDGENSVADDDQSMSTLGNAKNEKKGAHGVTDLTPGGYHCATLLAADLAYERPLMITIGADCTARLWNYQTMKCELTHDFGADEPISVAFHSSGFQVLVSFKDRIKLYNVLMDKLKPSKEAILKNCKCLKFSNGSQYWAAASAINIVVYETKSFQQLVTFQGHMMTVVKLSWAPGDQVLFSAGMDGNVYGWPIAHSGRMDIISASNRSSLILDLEVDSGSTVFQPAPRETDDESTVGDAASVSFAGHGRDEGSHMMSPKDRHNLIVSSLDGNLRMPGWSLDSVSAKHGAKTVASSETTQLISGDPSCAVTALQLSADRTRLYVGTSLGTLRVYAWPPEVTVQTQSVHSHSHSHAHHTGTIGVTCPYYEIYTHAGPVVAIKLSPVDHTVISAAADGSVYVHTDVIAQAKPAATGNALDYDNLSDVMTLNDDVVLMAAEDIEEHINDVISLQKELLETNNKHEFQSRKVASEHAEQLKMIVEAHDIALNKEKDASDNYKAAAEKRISDFANSVEAKDADNQKMRTELENKYEHKLAEALERYDSLSEKMQLLKQKCEGLLEAEKNNFNKQLNDMKMETHNKEKKLKTDHRRAVEDKTANEAAFMEILRQQEDEYEDELKQMIDSVNFELASERETILKLRTLVQTKNTKLAQLKKKLIELNTSAQQHSAKVVEEVNARKALMATIEHYKKNLIEREEALAEKEKDVLELRSTTRTLENFRFVLDHRLQQLSSERGPITMHIEGLEKHIATMYEELVEEFSLKKANSEATALQEQKIAWISQDLNKMRQSVREKEQYITAFKRELNNIMSSMVVGKELEESVKLLYKKFVRGESESKAFIKLGDHIMEKVGDLMHGNDVDDHSVLSLDTADKRGGGGGGHARGHSADHSGMAQEIDEALVETAKEADRQKKFVERQANNLRHRLQNVNRESHTLARHRLNENSNLLFECNDLRMETKELNRKLAIKRNELDLAHRTIKELQTQLNITSRASSAAGEPRRASSPVRNANTATTNAVTYTSTSLPVSQQESLDSRYPAQWVVHNALNSGQDKQDKPNEPPLAPVIGRHALVTTTQIPTAKKMTKSALSQSAPALQDDDSTVTEPPLQHKSAANLHLGVGKTKQLSMTPSASSDMVVKEMKLSNRRSNKPGMAAVSASEWQVEKLSKEVSNLADQLDDALREKEVQRMEINKLRKLMMTTSIAPGAATNSSTYQALNNPLHLPSIVTSTYSADSMDGKDMRQLSNADVYGVPSAADMADMQLRPTTAGGTPLNSTSERNNAYLNNPVLNASRRNSGHLALSPKRFLRDKNAGSNSNSELSIKSSVKFNPSSMKAGAGANQGGSKSGKNTNGGRDLQELSLHSHEPHESSYD